MREINAYTCLMDRCFRSSSLTGFTGSRHVNECIKIHGYEHEANGVIAKRYLITWTLYGYLILVVINLYAWTEGKAVFRIIRDMSWICRILFRITTIFASDKICLIKLEKNQLISNELVYLESYFKFDLLKNFLFASHKIFLILSWKESITFQWIGIFGKLF